MRNAVLRPEPAARVEVEEPGRTRRPLLELRRQRREQLQPRRRQLAAETELRGRTGHACGEQRLRLVGGEPGQPGAVAAGEPVAAGGPAHRLDRDAGGAERLDVAVHRPHRDLQPPGDVRRRQLAPRLEEQQERDETRRAHFLNMTEDVLFVCKSRRHGGATSGVTSGTRSATTSRENGAQAAAPAAEPARCSGATVYELPTRAAAVVVPLPPRRRGAARSCCTAGVTLRTPAGERELAAGEPVYFPLGPTARTGSVNDTGRPGPVPVAGTRFSPEVSSTPTWASSRRSRAWTRRRAEPLFVIHTLEEGEQ